MPGDQGTSLGIIRRRSFHGTVGKMHPGSFCGYLLIPLGEMCSRPMLAALSVLAPGQRQKLGQKERNDLTLISATILAMF